MKSTGPSGSPVTGRDSDEPDSLELGQTEMATTIPVASTSSVTDIGTLRSSEVADGDLLALLRLERLAQQATQRDYEALRKQYQRYFVSYMFS